MVLCCYRCVKMTVQPFMKLWNSRQFQLPKYVNCRKCFKKLSKTSCRSTLFLQFFYILQAGITTTLNSRCSVLAAANSVFGRWDETKGEEVVHLITTFHTLFISVIIFLHNCECLLMSEISLFARTQTSCQQFCHVLI